MGPLDRLDQPEEPRSTERTRDADTVRPPTPEMADPDERGRVYEATRAYVSAETGERAPPDRRPDVAEKGGYWSEVPRFGAMWADHQKRWPDRQDATADSSADPPGSYCSKGGFKLNPERHAETVEAIGRMREAGPGISADMQTIEQENGYGGWLEGFKFHLKGDDRLKEKVAERLEGEPDKTSAEILQKVPDAIRYTFCMRPESYTDGYYDIKERLESRGYQIYESRNSWHGAEYKGINTRWVSPEGQRFEVQFHTPTSFHAKQYVTHDAYERIRDPRTSDEERAELKEFERDVCTKIRVPDRAAEIPDFKKEGF